MVFGQKELSHDPEIVNVLRGEVSKPVQTAFYKDGVKGSLTSVRLAMEGPCMHGLTDYKDNRLWWGMARMHQGRSASLAVHYGTIMQRAGYEVSLETIVNGMNVSHAGRRQWEEADYYREAVPDFAQKLAISNETLGLRLIQNKVPEDIFILVSSLAYSDEYLVEQGVYDSLEHRLTDLADHQTTHTFAPLHERMGDFIARNFFRGLTTPEAKQPVIDTLNEIITRQREFSHGISGRREVSLDEASDMMLEIGASPVSSRSTLRLQLRNFLKDAQTQAMLINAGVDPDKVNEKTVPVSSWEHLLRVEYLEFAMESLIEATREGYQIPLDTEWGRYAQMILPRSLKKK